MNKTQQYCWFTQQGIEWLPGSTWSEGEENKIKCVRKSTPRNAGDGHLHSDPKWMCRMLAYNWITIKIKQYATRGISLMWSWTCGSAGRRIKLIRCCTLLCQCLHSPTLPCPGSRRGQYNYFMLVCYNKHLAEFLHVFFMTRVLFPRPESPCHISLLCSPLMRLTNRLDASDTRWQYIPQMWYEDRQTDWLIDKRLTGKMT